MTNSFLLEIYSEEIPAKMQDTALARLENIFLSALKKENIIYKNTKPVCYITPCRIIFYLQNLISEATEDTVIRGPKQSSAQEVINGFLKKYHLHGVSELEERDGYYHYVHKNNSSLEKIMAELVNNLWKSFTNVWNKKMHWNQSLHEWIRPVRNIMCLLNDKIIPIERFGLTANNITYGNKNITQQKAITISHVDLYFEQLIKHYVVPDKLTRITAIKSQIKTLTKNINGNFSLSKREHLLSEIAGLCEFPHVIQAKLDQKYLELPYMAVIATMEKDQRYIPFKLADSFFSDNPNITHSQGSLEKFFFIVAECLPENEQIVLEGNMKVLNARLADIYYFSENDKKELSVTPAEALQKLSTIYINKTDTLLDRINRIKEIILNLLNHDINHDHTDIKNQVLIAIPYCKLDHVSHIYHEFPELQGEIGYYYATKLWKLNKDAALAIRDQYRPRHKNEKIDLNTLSFLFALAEKLEYIFTNLHQGTTYTSSSDPFGLSRTLAAIIRILLDALIEEGKISIDVEFELNEKWLQSILPNLYHPHINTFISFLEKEFKEFCVQDIHNSPLNNQSSLDSGIIKKIVDNSYKFYTQKTKVIFNLWDKITLIAGLYSISHFSIDNWHGKLLAIYKRLINLEDSNITADPDTFQNPPSEVSNEEKNNIISIGKQLTAIPIKISSTLTTKESEIAEKQIGQSINSLYQEVMNYLDHYQINTEIKEVTLYRQTVIKSILNGLKSKFDFLTLLASIE